MNNVLVVGSGGREHALAWKLAQSEQVEVVFVAPGNGGTCEGKIQSVEIPVTDHQALISFARDNRVALSVIGPDDALASGIVDDFQSAGLLVFGPTKNAARIESSKAFAKDLMKKSGINTAAYKTFTNVQDAREYLETVSLPIVLKASGLALGKGVYVCTTREEAEQALAELMEEKKHGASGEEIVIEAFLEGIELSTHAFCDGNTAVMFPPSQDHKAVYDGNKGPNTGGMGVVAPLPWADDALMQSVKTEIIDPILQSLKNEGSPFSGLLYPGLMKTKDNLAVVEFNARFGDPETQCYMRLLESDLFAVLSSCAKGTLSDQKVVWNTRFVACVVLASEGYPGSYEKGKTIEGIEEAEHNPDVVVFHAGTKKEEGTLLTNGGRVFNVTATGNTLQEALHTAYEAVEKINFEGKYFRTDIGKATLEQK